MPPWKISYDWEGGGQLESMETNVEQLYEGGEWSFKNSGSRKILVEFHESRSLVSFSVYVRLAVSFFIWRCLGVSNFCKTKGLEVPIRFFVCFKMTASRHSILNFIKATSISEKNSILTSPKLSEFHKKVALR